MTLKSSPEICDFRFNFVHILLTNSRWNSDMMGKTTFWIEICLLAVCNPDFSRIIEKLWFIFGSGCRNTQLCLPGENHYEIAWTCSHLPLWHMISMLVQLSTALLRLKKPAKPIQKSSSTIYSCSDFWIEFREKGWVTSLNSILWDWQVF